ncbi:MAG: hypothetical protein HQ568_09955 [Calditrichaeota bacterium]|nr:hypothetical protein [Calditrichota bacterium]
MSRTLSRSSRRIWVTINYSSLILLIVLFRLGQFKGLSVLIAVAMIVALITLVWSFIRLHKKTGLFKLVHTSIKKLDEREIQLTHEALRHSYSIFVITCLLIIYIISVFEIGRIDAMLAAGLVYLAHTLPASVIAWTEKEV